MDEKYLTPNVDSIASFSNCILRGYCRRMVTIVCDDGSADDRRKLASNSRHSDGAPALVVADAKVDREGSGGAPAERVSRKAVEDSMDG